ncbi:MAG: hypothetical protein ACI9IJ_002250, partial [Psychromonas sp.]
MPAGKQPGHAELILSYPRLWPDSPYYHMKGMPLRGYSFFVPMFELVITSSA